ncbi:MAG: sulfotransferase [Proteobacteria bacterium]|nr:sulfotransferase [Pseudomonadota bacterium]
MQALRARQAGDAERNLRAALAQAPGHPEVQRLLAIALRMQGMNGEALELLRQAADRWPDDVMMQNGLGTALDASGDRVAAIAAFRRACELAPEAAVLWANLGKTLGDYSQFEEAIPVLEHALRIAPHAASSIRLAHALRAIGRIDEAEQRLRAMLADAPADNEVWLALAGLKTRPLKKSDSARMQALLQRADLKPGERISLLFALAKSYDDQRLYEQAFAAYVDGNAATRRIHHWDAGLFRAFVDDILHAFARPVADIPGQQGDEVIFIVSLPRSGSSLTEQILASHPKVVGAGELDSTTVVIDTESARRGEPFPLWVKAATPEDWLRMGRHYLDLTERWRKPGQRFTDKLPGNWLRVGAIFAMLPGARVIDCRRDPVESCFSCFRTLFSHANQPFSYELGDIAAYWRDYDRASRHWQALYPKAFRAQQYEALVADPEAQTRELLDFCGLDFDPACLRYWEAQHSVRTASAAQVREPIRKDTARANRYGALLDPLRTELGLPPFAAR